MTETANRRRLDRIMTLAGYIAIVASSLILVVGLILVEAAARDFKASVDVTRGAVTAIDDTVVLIEDATATLDTGIESATAAIEGVSDTATIGSDGIEGLADFLENDLSEDLESMRSAMPAAIQAAAAIDGTLRVLTLLGVDYDPDQPFDESLRRFESALSDLPDGLRVQSEVLRNLAPAASALGQESEKLAAALDQIGEDLGEIETITTAYSTTLREATVTLEETSNSLDRNTWLLRLLVVAIAVTGGALGSGLVAGGRALARTEQIPTVERSVVLVND